MTVHSHRPISAWLALVVAAGALAGCAAAEQNRMRAAFDEGANVYPQDYKADLLAYFRVYLNDPTNVRDAYASEPVIRNVGFGNRYTVCVQFNAKNSDGRYTGSKQGLAIFARGHFEQFTTQIKDQCSQADYKPFPELEKLSR